MYYFNVCGDANLVPAACVSLEKAVQVLTCVQATARRCACRQIIDRDGLGWFLGVVNIDVPLMLF